MRVAGVDAGLAYKTFTDLTTFAGSIQILFFILTAKFRKFAV
jgi:hypothetical protein